MHSYGPYRYNTDDFSTIGNTGNAFANIEVDAGETRTFSVKARNSADLLSNAATINITGPDAG